MTGSSSELAGGYEGSKGREAHAVANQVIMNMLCDFVVVEGWIHGQWN